MMRLKFLSIITSLLFFVTIGLKPLAAPVFAADSCSSMGIFLTENTLPSHVVTGDTNSYVISVTLPANFDPPPSNDFRLVNFEKQTLADDERGRVAPAGISGNTMSFILNDPTWFVNGSGDTDNMKVELWGSRGGGAFKCELISDYTIEPIQSDAAGVDFSCSIAMTQPNSSGDETAGCFDQRDITIFISNVTLNGQPYTNRDTENVEISLLGLTGGNAGFVRHPITIRNGNGFYTLSSDLFSSGRELTAYLRVNGRDICTTRDTVGEVKIQDNCSDQDRGTDIIQGPGNIDFQQTGEKVDWELCNQVPGDPGDGDSKRGICNRCQDSGGVWTAVGCITHTPGGIVNQITQVGLFIAGGIALLMIIIAAFKFTISKGDPKRVGEAKELLQSAIIGLLFIVFSVTILQFIGVTIFRIPGFGG